MMGLIDRILYAYWESQRVYLSGRVEEIKAEQEHLRQDQMRVEQRLKRAEHRMIQYGRTT